jgi:site-specific recombinase XerD
MQKQLIVHPDLPKHYARYRRFVELKSLRARTIKGYLHWIAQIELFHQTGDAPDYTEDEVLEFLHYLRDQRKLRPASLNVAVVALRCFYRDLMGFAWPCWKQIRIKADPKLPCVLTRQEVAAWIGAIREARFSTFAALVYHTGLRMNEALQIQVADLNARPGHLLVREGKGGRQRLVPLAEPMRQQLRAWWALHRNPVWLFPAPGQGWKVRFRSLSEAMRQSDAPMSASSVQGALKLALLESGLKKAASCHTLRHSYATHLLEEGISVRQLATYLGHSSLQTTMVYLHLTEISEAKTVQALEKLHAGLRQPDQAKPTRA